MQWTEIFGYLGALMTLTTFSMKTMLHLRIAGIVSNLVFITYGGLGHVYPVLLLHLSLLPLNVWRLRQLLQLTREMKLIASSRLSMEWLKPFSRRRAAQAGETLFRRGDAAAEVLFVLGGKFRAVEADVVLEQGELIGELGLINREHTRTQTVVCEEAGPLLVVTYDEVRQMYFQNPKFGFFFLELVAERLTRDARRVTPAQDAALSLHAGSRPASRR
ncbi:cyclic nucleotide-binding domain-containing protein [Variovorax sp. J2P1-59]|uniref:Crp/Fnr family transcriptional regulator n=1 Tax=Variovorax flavidus TaxID=3053501 RepID=UPI002579114B|nr:cyclic nucleotide-binding domain-containing protein [Variovorax sp. J2P1-59]MDM0073764.1 cyclic nucleotide-binding domain-containing protein [Variovorax sp. J2P1-59]